MLGLQNPLHIAIVLAVVVMLFGAKRLPEMGKSLGSGLRGFRETMSGEDSTPHVTATLGESSAVKRDAPLN